MPKPNAEKIEERRSQPGLLLPDAPEQLRVENWCGTPADRLIVTPQTVGELIDRMLASERWHNLPEYGAKYNRRQTVRDRHRYCLQPLAAWRGLLLHKEPGMRGKALTAAQVTRYAKAIDLPAAGSNAAHGKTAQDTFVRNRQVALNFLFRYAYDMRAITAKRYRQLMKAIGSSLEPGPRRRDDIWLVKGVLTYSGGVVGGNVDRRLTEEQERRQRINHLENLRRLAIGERDRALRLIADIDREMEKLAPL